MSDLRAEEIVEDSLKSLNKGGLEVGRVSLEYGSIKIYIHGVEKFDIRVKTNNYPEVFSNLLQLMNKYKFKNLSFDLQFEDQKVYEDIFKEFDENYRKGSTCLN